MDGFLLLLVGRVDALINDTRIDPHCHRCQYGRECVSSLGRHDPSCQPGQQHNKCGGHTSCCQQAE